LHNFISGRTPLSTTINLQITNPGEAVRRYDWRLADVKFDCPGVFFLALNGQRGSALVAERPPHPRRGLIDLAFPFREPDLVGLENYQRDDRCAVVPPAIRTVAMAGDHRLAHGLETYRATKAPAGPCSRSVTLYRSNPPLNRHPKEITSSRTEQTTHSTASARSEHSGFAVQLERIGIIYSQSTPLVKYPTGELDKLGR
jgi:hypothetical protein